MKPLLSTLLLLVGLAWGADVLTQPLPDAHPLWLARQEGLYLSGLMSIALMSLGMLLATRPVWLEKPLDGMDRIYRSHKWAGILAIGFAATHWLIEMSGDILKSTIGREGRVPKEKFTGLAEVLRDLAKDLGEWAIYFALAMLVISLWKRFPYRAWQLLHKAMPLLYLALGFHAAMLAPRDYWTQPVGALLAVLLVVGAYGALRALLGGIGRARRTTGEILDVDSTTPDVTGVRCRLNAWPGHRPGQFAFVTFDPREGAHPFTLASADRGDHTVDFQIKALGDYTRKLAGRLKPGQKVQVEGPYGRFDLARCRPDARQIWIAGGIGITPFLAWLEALQGRPAADVPPAALHYCTRDRAADPFVARLENLCAGLPGVSLHIHGAQQGERLGAAALGDTRQAEIWFCGPGGLADSLRGELASLGRRPRFHQEAFEMR
jgi:predicted ferric reductase